MDKKGIGLRLKERQKIEIIASSNNETIELVQDVKRYEQRKTTYNGTKEKRKTAKRANCGNGFP